MPTVKKLQFANGTDVTEAVDLSIESSTNNLESYANDAAFEVANPGLSDGDIYINTTTGTARLYVNGQWWSCVIKENAIIVDANFSLVDNGDGTKIAKFDVANVPSGVTKTYAVPAIATSSDTLVTENSVQELKGKTIDGNFNTLTNLDFGTLSGEVNPQNGGTGISNPAGATLTRTGAFDLNITCTAETDVTMPVSGTLATLTDVNTTQLTGTLAPAKGGLGTNASAFNGVVKADGAGNFSASTVTNTDVSATAAIARSKVASGTANHIVINDGTGVLSSEATLAKSRGGSGQDNTNLIFPSTGTLATLAGSENLSSKTLVEPVVDNFLTFNEETAGPVTVSTGKVAVYAKEDGKIYKKDDTQTETEIGAGGSGTGRNYLQDWFDGNKPITVSATTLAATANRTTDTTLWARSTVAGLTISNNAINPLRQAGDFLIDSSATTINSFVESPLWTLDVADLGKPLSIEFDLTGIAANTSYDVVVVRYNNTGTYQETISVAGTASTGTPSSAQLPTGTVKFRGFYVPSSTSTDQYALRLRKVAAVDDDFQIDSLFVGPQSLAQGAVVTAWQAYTPTFSSGWGTPTNISFSYRRVGTSMEVRGTFTAGTTTTGLGSISLPLGTISATLSNTSANPGPIIGTYGANTTQANGFLVSATGTSSNLVYIADYFSKASAATPISPAANVSGVVTSSTAVSVQFSVVISEWIGSGTTTLADRAVEEYVFNTSGITAANASNTTAFGYGPQGFAIGSIDSSTVSANQSTNFRCRFTTPILPTDKISIEFDRFADGKWVDAATFTNQMTATLGTASYGVSFIPVSGSNTDIDVSFGNGGRLSTSTYGLAGSPWSGISSAKWRVRKVSGGAAVGFPVSARNIVGDTSGTAVPSGYVGQILQVTGASTTGLTVSLSNITSLTLTPGVWIINGGAQISGTGGTYFSLGISTTSASSVGTIIGYSYYPFAANGSAGVASGIVNIYVNISTNTTYYLIGGTNMTGLSSGAGSLTAIRIA